VTVTLRWRTLLVIAAALGLLGAGRAACRPCAVDAGLVTAQLGTGG
jgi:hypothetical protein